MTIVRCKLGPAQTTVMGVTYNFDPDAAGRAVAHVGIDRHVVLLLSAGTYEEVDPLPVATILANQAPDLDAIRAELRNSAVPSFIATEPALDASPIILTEPWPDLVGLELSEMIENLPPFITIDPNDKMIVRVSNASAEYALKGTADGTRLYTLLPGSTYTEYVPAPPEGAPLPGAEGEAGPAGEPATTDDLTKISGIGQATATKLNALGIVTFAQIAGWTAEDVAKFEAELKMNKAITRDKWVEQAAVFIALPN